MTPPIPYFFGTPAVRRAWYKAISLLVITSLLLQPITAVAAIYRTAAVLRAAILAAADRPIATPMRLLPHEEQTAAQTAIARTTHPMPQPRLRTAALANPTPSGAKPAYPLNHVLDANPQPVGTPPSNYNFETAGYYVGTPPTNADLSAAIADTGTPPTNADFATGDLTGWTTSGTVTIQSDATYSNYARLQSSAVLVSDAFTVDSTAQQIAFAIGYFSSAAINLYVLSGAGYSTRTKIDYLYCNSCGWTTYTLDAAAYSGQSIKLEFNRAGGTLGIDNLQMRILLPGYTVQNPIERVEQSNGNVYASLGSNGLLTSAAFTVDSSAQVASVDITGLTANNDQYRIDVLSGPTFATVTQVAVNTNAPDSWQRVQLNLAAWQGQSIQLRVTGLLRTIGVDNIGVQSIFLPGWQFSGTATIGDDGDGNHYVATAGNLVSAPFTLDANLQQITLRHRSGEAVVNRFELKLLRGVNFSQEVDLTGGQVTSNPGTWQTFKLALNLYAGETVKLKLVAIGPMHFDDAGLGENLLPGWQLTNDGAIATGTDSYGSYVTAANSGLFAVRSSEMSTGIINRSTSVDRRYYAVAYDIGYVTGSLLRVYWVDAQGYSIQLMQDAANTPTGYRERYFWISDAQAQTGRLVVSLAGQGKLYSVADNIARQQLAEPFSYKVGWQIDTASGSFGYQAQDMQIAGVTPLVFTRYYNGHSDRLGRMGYGWSHSYETRLVITDDLDAGVVFGSGKEIFFTWLGSSQTFTAADARVYDKLVKNSNGTYTFTTKANQRYHFTATGVLISVQDPNDNTVTLLYNGSGQLTSVVAQGGATFSLAYNANGYLATVTDPLNAVVTYTYDAAGDLVSVTRPDSGVEAYSYNQHRLSQVVDATNHLLFQNTFDSWHRVVQQTDALGRALTIQYSTPAAGVTAVTDPKSGVSYYYFDIYQRTTHWLDPNGVLTAYLYDSLGNLQAVVGDGQQWNFAYDVNGNLLSSTDPLGNPTLFTYNPQHKPTTLVDGNGNTTAFAYDIKGNVTQITDALGGITTFTYDSAGNLLTKTDPLGHTESYTYDSAGNRLTRTDALGHTWSWTYNAAHRVTDETDPNGHMTRYFYDLVGRLIAVRNHLGGQKNFLYDKVGHLLMAEDEAGQRTLWDYDVRGLVERKIDAAGKVNTYTYDDNRNMLTMTDPLSHTTTYGYDAGNRLITLIKANGATWHYEYDGNSKLTREVNPLGKDVRYFYDEAGHLVHTRFSDDIYYVFDYDGNGNLTKKNDPYGSVTYTYDALNRLTTVSDDVGTIGAYGYDAASRRITASNAANQTTALTYDAANRLTAVTDPLGHSTAFTYDAANNRLSTTDALGRTNSVVYDALNRPIGLVDANSKQTQVVYDVVSQITQLIAPTGATTTFTYDARGLQTNITNPLNQQTTNVYDDGGRLIQQIDAANQATTYAYNNVDWLTTVTNPLGKSTTYTYDLVGNVTGITDPLGRTQSITYNEFNQPATATSAGITNWFEYDLLGRLITRGAFNGALYFGYNSRGLLTDVTGSLQQRISYEYDNVGRRIKIIDARNNQTLLSYDAASRLTSMTDALGGVVTYGYDAANQLTSVTNPNGKSTTYSYDLLGNLLSKTDPLNRTQSFGYDQFGRRTSATDARGISVTYGYDLLDRLSTVTHPNGADSYTYDAVGRLAIATNSTGATTFTYDAASRVTAVAAPQGTVTYGYNDAGQRTNMTLPGARTVAYGYDTVGRLNALTDWQGRTNTLTYNAEGALNEVVHPNSISANYSYNQDGSLFGVTYNPNNFFSAEYRYDGNKNRTSVTTPAGTESYTLDALNRLTNVAYPNGDTAAYSYDANGNRLSQTVNGATTNYTYDDAGQLLSDGTTTYTYDANGNLTSAGADTYTWDWANRLTSATVNGQTVNYTYDALSVRAGATVSGTAQSYLWDRLAAQPLLVDDGAQAYLHGAGLLAQIDPAGVRQDLVNDGLGSIRGVTDSSGALMGAADYGVFGNYRNQSGATSRFGFTGEYFAQETGFWHLRARDLNPTLGRFLSADPVQPNAPGTQGYNPYAYVANNPTTWVDPSGYSSALPTNLTPGQTAILVSLMVSLPAMLLVPGVVGVPFLIFALTIHCALTQGCLPRLKEMNKFIDTLGSSGINTVEWTIETLNTAFAKYPLLPEAPPAMQLMAGLGLGLLGLDTVTDFATLISGRDPITGHALTPQEMFVTWLAFSIPLVSAGALHGFTDDAAEWASRTTFASHGGCSFDGETPVATDEGRVAISEITVGDQVLAWDEALGETGYYTVTAVWGHEDPVTVQLVINGETIETTPEHPFYELENAPPALNLVEGWIDVGATQGRWTPAGELKAGDHIRQADGTTGVVQTVVFEATPQVMYNLTVADAHTFFVGDGEWLVHNVCLLTGSSYLSEARSGISNGLQDSIVAAIHEQGDSGLLAAFRGSEPGSFIWHGSVRAKPMGASNLWEGAAGLRFGTIPGGTMGYYVSDLDGAWVLSGAGVRINDGQLLARKGLYSRINELYNVDIIQHGAHMNYILDGLKGEPLSSRRLGKALSYLSDQVYIFGYNGYVGSGSMRNTFYQYFIPR